MSSLLQVRNVPEEARRVLKSRAAARGESLNSYMLGLIEMEVARPTATEVMERVERRGTMRKIDAVEALDEARRERDEQLMDRLRR